MRVVLLILITLILVYILFSQNFLTDFFIYEDETYPRPIIEIELYCKNGTIKIISGGKVNGCLDGSILELSVKLINNSSEPSLRRYDLSAGFLLIIDGGKIVEYNIRDFNDIVGISSKLELIAPINSSMVEVFTNYMGAGEVKRSYFKVRVDPGEDLVKISFRGWIIDEDKKIYNPITGEEEYYVARYPVEEYEENPPDTRWAGKEFLKYKVYTIEVARDLSSEKLSI